MENDGAEVLRSRGVVGLLLVSGGTRAERLVFINCIDNAYRMPFEFTDADGVLLHKDFNSFDKNKFFDKNSLRRIAENKSGHKTPWIQYLALSVQADLQRDFEDLTISPEDQ